MKDDDPLLARLGEALRSRRKREGAPSLEAQADSDSGLPADLPGAPGDEAMRREVFAPFPERLRAGIVDRSLRAVAQTPAAPSARTETASPRPRRRRAPGGALGVLVAAAAAAWLLWPGPELPSYTLTVEGGDRAVRGSSGERPGAGQPIAVEPGSEIELVLRPATPIARPVQARLYIVAPSGAPPVVTDRSPEVAPGGSVRWKGSVRDLLGGRTGDLELLLVVSRGSSQPTPAELGRDGADRGRGWQSFRARVRVISER